MLLQIAPYAFFCLVSPSSPAFLEDLLLLSHLLEEFFGTIVILSKVQKHRFSVKCQVPSSQSLFHLLPSNRKCLDNILGEYFIHFISLLESGTGLASRCLKVIQICLTLRQTNHRPQHSIQIIPCPLSGKRILLFWNLYNTISCLNLRRHVKIC